jgi:hypothetical protein
MSAIDELLEDLRQKRLGDGRYIGSYPYALEMKVPQTEEPLGSVVFVFPFGPDRLSVKRAFAQAVVPTLGGVVAEERGLVWRDITVAGHFGLAPKAGYDTTTRSPGAGEGLGPVMLSDKLSGPLWVRRLLTNIFDRYAALKADPETSADTVLIWHNFKDEESLVVVPVEVDLERTTATRHLYPFTLTFKAIGPADKLILPAETLGPLAAFLAAVGNVLKAVSRAVALVSAAFQEASAFLGEVRYFLATVDAVFDSIGRIVGAAQDFAQGVTDTIATGAGILDSALDALDTFLALLESDTPNSAGISAAATVPPEVRQTFAEMQDGLFGIRSQLSAFATSYASEAAAHADESRGTNATSDEELDAAAASPATTAAELEAQTTGAGDRTRKDGDALPRERVFRKYTGFFPYTVMGGDTVQGIAARFLGDGTLWYDIVVVNALKPPYISWAGGPSIARPGDILLVPQLGGAVRTNSAGRSSGATEEALFGRDCRLAETRNSRPGRPAVDLVVDTRTSRDLASIGGIDNLVQAVQLRMWTMRGSMPHYPGYGVPPAVGFGNTAANLTALKVGLKATIAQDSRIAAVLAIRATASGDTLEVDADVLPVGSTTRPTLSTVGV